jgi:hypothetical protein
MHRGVSAVKYVEGRKAGAAPKGLVALDQKFQLMHLRFEGESYWMNLVQLPAFEVEVASDPTAT